MRAMHLIPLLLCGCAMGNPQRDYERWQREIEREESGKPTIWIDVDHPMAYLYGGAGPTQFSYSNRAGRDERVDAMTYRAGFLGPMAMTLDWTGTTEDMTGGTSADTWDLFVFANRPLWPNRRLRFQSRPGFYYDRLDMRDARAGDTKPWTIGLRFELEGEVDVVKLRTFNLSLFANGRIGGGWGRTSVAGTSVESSSWGSGWEAGVRIQYARIVGSLSWMERQTRLEGDPLVEGVEYGFEGPALMFGMRW